MGAYEGKRPGRGLSARGSANLRDQIRPGVYRGGHPPIGDFPRRSFVVGHNLLLCEAAAFADVALRRITYIDIACARKLAQAFSIKVYGGDDMQDLAMAETRRVTKTENISLRLDPKTKFILDFVVRMKGVRTTDLVARAIKEMADSTSVGSNGYGEVARTWLNYWHPEEGVRILRLIMDSDIPTTFDEDEMADFVKQHREFFFISQDYSDPIIAFIQVIWPDIDTYLDHWRENKAKSRWATGELMLKAIKKADMRGPDWPRGAKPAAPVKPASNDLDDEIPF